MRRTFHLCLTQVLIFRRLVLSDKQAAIVQITIYALIWGRVAVAAGLASVLDIPLPTDTSQLLL